MLPAGGLRIALLDPITIVVKVLTRYFEYGPVGYCFHLMRLARYVPDDITRTKTLLMVLPDFGINPPMDKLALCHVPCLVFEQMIVHAGLCSLTKHQQLAAIKLIVCEYQLFTPALWNFQSMRGYGLYHLGLRSPAGLMHKI